MELIGKGATAEVFKVFCPYKGRESARKVYADGFEKLAKQEYDVLTQLAFSPYIPEVYSFDSGRTLELEYCPRSVAEVAGNSWENVVRYVRDAAEAVHLAHTRGVLHLDLKPDHLRVGADNLVRVLDFGNKTPALDDLLVSSNENNAFMTRLFAAPEQLAKGTVGPETDVYGLGATLYFLLTKQFPIGQLRPPSSYNSLIPKELDSIVLKALSHEKSDRHQTALEFFAALDHLAFPQPQISSSLYARDGMLAMTFTAISLHKIIGDSLQSVQGSLAIGAMVGVMMYFASRGCRRNSFINSL